MPWKLDYHNGIGTYVKLKICPFKHRGRRMAMSTLGVPYILSCHQMRDKRLCLSLHGGKGDVVSAVFFPDYSLDARAMLREFIKTGDISYLVPLNDKLMELEHWITGILGKWIKYANMQNENCQIELTEPEIRINRPLYCTEKPAPKLDDLLNV